MRRWVVSTFPSLDPDFETEQFIRYWRSEGRRKRNWHDAWQKWIADSHQRARERQQRGAPGNVTPIRRSTADERVAAGQALAAKFRAEEARALEAARPTNQELA